MPGRGQPQRTHVQAPLWRGPCTGSSTLVPLPRPLSLPLSPLVQDSFGNSSLFHKALKEAFEAFCNKQVGC